MLFSESLFPPPVFVSFFLLHSFYPFNVFHYQGKFSPSVQVLIHFQSTVASSPTFLITWSSCLSFNCKFISYPPCSTPTTTTFTPIPAPLIKNTFLEPHDASSPGDIKTSYNLVPPLTALESISYTTSTVLVMLGTLLGV